MTTTPNKTSNRLRLMAGTAAVALAFNAGTVAAAGFLDDPGALVGARANLSQALSKAVPDDPAPSLAAGSFMGRLEATMKTPAAAPRIVVDPPVNSTNQLVVAAVAPPAGYEYLPIRVCAQKDKVVRAVWDILANGSVVSRPALQNPEGSTRAACNATLMAAQNDINTKLAQPNAPSQPPPLQAEQKAISKPSASLAIATPNG